MYFEALVRSVCYPLGVLDCACVVDLQHQFKMMQPKMIIMLINMGKMET